MKFEIDDKTGMIREIEFGTQDNPVRYGSEKINSLNLETILQAVKKTQAKLVNKQIQEIQDSKRRRISLREEDITSEPGRIIIRLNPDTPQHFENLRKQILHDNSKNYISSDIKHLKKYTPDEYLEYLRKIAKSGEDIKDLS